LLEPINQKKGEDEDSSLFILTHSQWLPPKKSLYDGFMGESKNNIFGALYLLFGAGLGKTIFFGNPD